MNKRIAIALFILVENFLVFSESILSVPFSVNKWNRIEIEGCQEDSLKKFEFATGVFPSIFSTEVNKKILLNNGEKGTFNICERFITANIFYTDEFSFPCNENIKVGIPFIYKDVTLNNFFKEDVIGLATFSTMNLPLEISFSTKKITLLECVPDNYKKSYPFLIEHNAMFILIVRNDHEYKMKLCTEMDTEMQFPPMNGKYGFIGINAMKNYDTVFDFKNKVLWFKKIE